MGNVSRSSITLSSASYASSLFPTVDEASSSLIEAILSRVSPHESEWKPFLQAYDEVFNERGLDKQSDTVIYDLILKLGLQAGKNWRAKWENVKRTQHELLLQREGAQRVDQVAKRDTLRTPINKGRISARDAAASHTHYQEYEYEDAGQPRLTQEALDKLQHAASPYKPLQTPYAGARLNTRDTTTPRVHFANEVHKHHTRAHSDVFRTPELSVAPSHTAEEREAMLRQAMQFDRINLLGRMYDDWISRFFVLKRLDMHTSLARDALMKRRSLTFWRERIERHGELEERVDLAYEATLQRTCLRLWQQKREKKQKTEWERQMSMACRTIARKKDRQMKEAAFAAWREASLDSRAFEFRRLCLLKQSLGKWLSNAARLAELHTEADAVQASRDEILVVEAFARWKLNTILLIREEEIAEKREDRLLRDALATWRVHVQDIRLADDYASRRASKRVFATWKARAQHNETLKLQAMSLSLARDEDTMERAFHTWKIREHARLLERAKSIRLAKGAFQRWRERFTAITVGLEEKASVLQSAHEIRLAGTYLSRWLDKNRQHRKALRLASSLHSRLLLQRTFADWQLEMTHRRLELRKAEVANTFFAQRGALKTWCKRLRWLQANKAVAGKEANLVKVYFTAWREKTRRSRHFAILEEGISAAIDQRIMSNALSSWTNRVIELRARALTVTQDRNTRLLQGAFSHWLGKSRQNIENLSLVDSFIDVQEEELLRSRFRKWHASAKRKAYLRQLLLEKLEDDERNLVAGVFDRWVDVYKERQLIDQEMDIVRYRTYQSLGGALQRWKARTMTLPAIRFDAQRQRKRFYSIWREKLPERIQENQAIEHDQVRLLQATFTVWQGGARAKAARRAANRFRAFAARSPLPPPSSSSPFSRYLSVPQTAGTGRMHNSSSLYAAAAPTHPTHASTSNTPIRRNVPSVLSSPFVKREGMPPSISMPGLYSASRLRKEVGGTTPTRRIATSTTNTTPAHGIVSYRQPAQFNEVKQRRNSVLEPESIALPPSSSATGPSTSSASSSPLAHQSPLPVSPQPALKPPATMGVEAHDISRHRRTPSGSKDAFEEGILKEMRERLAAAGLGSGAGVTRKDRKVKQEGSNAKSGNEVEDANNVDIEERQPVSRSRSQSRSRSRSRSRSIVQR